MSLGDIPDSYVFTSKASKFPMCSGPGKAWFRVPATQSEITGLTSSGSAPQNAKHVNSRENSEQIFQCIVIFTAFFCMVR